MGYSELGSREILGRIALTLEETARPAWLDQTAMYVSTDQETETYKWLSSLPAMREWIGGRNANRLDVQELVIRNKKYEATLEVGVDELRRAKIPAIQTRIQELATRASQHYAKLITEEIEAGTTTVAYDGQFFFDTDHSEVESGTQSNLLSIDIASPSAPTAAENESMIFDVLENFMSLKDAGGEPLNSEMSSLLFMVPVNMFGSMNAALNSQTITDGSGTRTNAALNTGFQIDLVVNPRLSANDALYAFRTDSSLKPFIVQEEVTPQLSSLAEGSDLEFNSQVHKYGVEKICGVGSALWQMATKVQYS